MNLLSKRIEMGANVAIIIVAALLGLVLIKNYLIATPERRTDSVADDAQPRNQTKISIPDVDWLKNGQTLILAVSTTCRFCTESGPFYQRLVKASGPTHLLAVVPQSVDEGKRYFEKLGVSVDEIKQASLSSIDVRGTPTLLLVNSDGVVVNTWVGKLRVAGEAEVLSKMQADRASN